MSVDDFADGMEINACETEEVKRVGVVELAGAFEVEELVAKSGSDLI